MSRLLTKDNRLFFDGSKRVVTLAPGQTPAECSCCGGVSDPCCTGLVNCFIKDNVLIKWSAKYDSSWTVFPTGDHFAFHNEVSSQKSTSFGNLWCNASCVKGTYDSLGQWPDATSTFHILTQTKDQQCPILDIGAGGNCGGGGFSGYPLRHLEMSFSPPASNKAPAFSGTVTMLQGGQTVFGWASKLDTDPVECVTTGIGDWGDGCSGSYDFSWYHKHIYKNKITKQPEGMYEFSMSVNFQIPWTSCGTGEKPSSPPPPPPTTGCASCGKKRTYTAI